LWSAVAGFCTFSSIPVHAVISTFAGVPSLTGISVTAGVPDDIYFPADASFPVVAD
jgi:hypothetical protein